MHTIDAGHDQKRLAVPLFLADKGETSGEREVSNTITAREDRGISKRKEEGTVVCIPVESDESYPGIYVEMPGGFMVYAVWYKKYQCYIAIRKLTPKECFRLQGFSDDLFEKARFINSDSQLYKQAGNAVTVNVTYEIGKALKEVEE